MAKVLLVIIVIVIVIVFISQAKFLRSLNLSGLFSTSTLSLYGIGQTTTSPQAKPLGGTKPSTQIESPTPPLSGATIPSQNPAVTPGGSTVSQLSPYSGKVRIGSVSASYFGFYSGGSLGQISLYASLGSNERINVTGWLLKGNRGSQFVPGAVNVYDPSGLAEESDIYLANGEVINMYTSYSPIGRNLRLNKCIGYLQNTMVFNPSLPGGCPSVNRSEILNFTGECQNYILSLGSCALPAPNPPIPQNDYSCQSFLNTLNYRGCFERHRGDQDFLSREWRVWTGSQFMDPQHDRIFLFDKNGLLIDEYIY